MSYRLDFQKDKLIEDDIDNGTSAKDEGDRRANRKGKKKKKKKKGDDPDAIKTKKKQKRKEIDFGNN